MGCSLPANNIKINFSDPGRRYETISQMLDIASHEIDVRSDVDDWSDYRKTLMDNFVSSTQEKDICSGNNRWRMSDEQLKAMSSTTDDISIFNLFDGANKVIYLERFDGAINSDNSHTLCASNALTKMNNLISLGKSDNIGVCFGSRDLTKSDIVISAFLKFGLVNNDINYIFIIDNAFSISDSEKAIRFCFKNHISILYIQNITPDVPVAEFVKFIEGRDCIYEKELNRITICDASVIDPAIIFPSVKNALELSMKEIIVNMPDIISGSIKEIKNNMNVIEFIDFISFNRFNYISEATNMANEFNLANIWNKPSSYWTVAYEMSNVLFGSKINIGTVKPLLLNASEFNVAINKTDYSIKQSFVDAGVIDAINIVNELIDLIIIWSDNLEQAGITLTFCKRLDSNGIEKLAKSLGIHDMVRAYEDGVPAEDITYDNGCAMRESIIEKLKANSSGSDNIILAELA